MSKVDADINYVKVIITVEGLKLSEIERYLDFINVKVNEHNMIKPDSIKFYVSGSKEEE